MTENFASIQSKLNEVNNKLAEAQVSNIRLNEHNDRLYELCKGSKIVESLEREHKKDLAEQKETFNDSKHKETRRETRKSSSTPKRNNKDKKCWFHENGFCKKGDTCDFLHPLQICSHCDKYGQCP